MVKMRGVTLKSRSRSGQGHDLIRSISSCLHKYQYAQVSSRSNERSLCYGSRSGKKKKKERKKERKKKKKILLMVVL